jgi:hypothetical protein
VLVLGALLVPLGCGGGGGGGGGGNNNVTPTPIQTVPSATPTPAGSPGPTPTPQAGAARIVLQNGDTIAPGVVVGNVEAAQLGNDGTIAVIVTIADAARDRAVYIRSPQGAYTSVFDSTSAPADVDLRTLARLRIAPTGEFTFIAGSGLDSDRVFFYSGGSVTPLAGEAPGVVAPTFRILGDLEIGKGGLVGFIGGGDQCTVTTVNTTTRTTCTIHLFAATGGHVSEVMLSGIDLSNLSPTTPGVAVSDAGSVYFSVPGRRSEPTLARFAGGNVSTVLSADTNLSGIGVLKRPQVIAVDPSEDVLLSSTVDTSSQTTTQVLGLLKGGQSFTTIVRVGDTVGSQSVIDLKGIGLDDTGQAFFQEHIGTPGDAASSVLSLQLGTTQPIEIARQGQPLTPGDLSVINVQEPRINRSGDVAFIALLGELEPGTSRVEEIRAVVRRADGQLVNVASTKTSSQVGSLSSLSIAGFDDNGTLLLIAARGNASTRALILAPSTS